LIIFDGSKTEKEMEGFPDQKENGLKKLPTLLEVFGFCYFFGSFLVGPQTTFRQYKQFVLDDKSDQKIKIPSSIIPSMKCFLLGIIYIGISVVGSEYYPSSYMSSPQFLYEISLFERYIAIWLCCKFAFMKYLGIWLLAEGSCILSGIGFNGYSKKPVDNNKALWNATSNVKIWEFETTLSLHGIVESFNTNTNDWLRRYIFKRLRFLGNKNVSQIITLLFLALWHGLYSGYFLCFMIEFLDMEAERRLKGWMLPILKVFEKTTITLYIYNLLTWIIRTYAVHYGLVGFEVKTLLNYHSTYSSLYYIGHFIPLIIYFFPPFGKKSKEL